MATLIEVLDENPNIAGEFYRINAGIQIGRSKGDIKIPDANISNPHARVEIDNKGQLVLLDMDSNNGLIINGRKVRKVALFPGVTFQIGKTRFRVKEVDDGEAERLVPLREPKDQVADAIRTLNMSHTPMQVPPQFFSKIIEIEFIAGIDFGKKLELTFGPRTMGFLNIDINLRDAAAPAVAFEISETNRQINITNKSTDGRLNDTVFSTATIKDGDVIQIGTTQMKLSLRSHAT